MQAIETKAQIRAGSKYYRWIQLLLGISCMAAVANLQYGWALFVNPIDAAHHWGKAAIQVAFTIFVLTETWLIPFEGYLADRYGSRVGVVFGGVLCALAWWMNSFAASLTILYIAAALGGLGVGAVVCSCFGNALRWFPDRRGLAMGLTASGVGFGSAITIAPLSNMIQSSGYQSAFLYFGIGQGIVVVILGLFLTTPVLGTVKREAVRRIGDLFQTKREYGPLEILKTPVFWVMYLMFVLVAAGGLMATAQLGVVAHDFGIFNLPVTILGVTLPALVFALTLDRTVNGLARPFFGWVSDIFGRENTMTAAFFAEAAGIFCLYWFGGVPIAFVLLSGIVFFAWGEIYSMFPTLSSDTFGTKFAATNASILYTAKGTASLLVPLSSLLTEYTGGWHATFIIAAAMNAVAALLAIFVLKPMRARMAATETSSTAPNQIPVTAVQPNATA
jgi:OFA family oxalate/formate antiporter-like MFS transporter